MPSPRLARSSSSKPLAMSVSRLMWGAPSSVLVPTMYSTTPRSGAPCSRACRSAGGDRLVDDLEVAAAGQLLELDQGEVGLDPGGVTVHQQADGPGRREHGGLGVAVAVLLAQLQGQVPRRAGCCEQVGRAHARVDADHLVVTPFVVAGRS